MLHACIPDALYFVADSVLGEGGEADSAQCLTRRLIKKPADVILLSINAFCVSV
jgi:hypothetical protein